jgi:anti-sigma B factor antagonist
MDSDTPAFSVRVEEVRSICQVVVQGEVDMATAPQLADAVAKAIIDTPGDLVIDLAGTTFLDSAGLKVIASARRHLPATCRVILRRPNPFIRRVLRIARTDSFCAIQN